MQEKERESRATLILGGLSLLFFLLWFSKGFNMIFYYDAMKEATNMIDYRFPQMLFSEIGSSGPGGFSAEGIWHRSRWSADVIGFISMNLFAQVIAFFTNDLPSAFFIAQGIQVAVIYVSLIWIIALYCAIIFKITIYSYRFILLLLLSSFGAVLLNFPLGIPHVLAPEIFTPVLLPPFLNNYFWTITLVLAALFPYWCAIFGNKYDFFNTITGKTIWYFLCFLAAFSSVNATVMYGFGLISFSFVLIWRKKSFLTFKTDWGKDTLFFGILILISLLAELIYGRDSPSKSFNGAMFVSFLEWGLRYLIAFAVLNIFPLIAVYIRRKKIPTDVTLSLSIFFIILFAYLFFLIVLSGKNASNLYLGCSSIMLIASFVVSWTLFFQNFRTPLVLSTSIFVLISHSIAYIPYNPGKDDRNASLRLLKKIDRLNKENAQIIEITPWEASEPGPYQDVVFTITKNFYYQTGLVAPHVKIILQNEKGDNPPNAHLSP